MLELLLSPEAWIAFATLTALELVLGIDNIIFISILVDKLPRERREIARRLGLFMAMFMRVALLLVLAWIVGLVEPLFTVFGLDVSGRDLILILGGLFLIWKSTSEIHESFEGAASPTPSGAAKAALGRDRPPAHRHRPAHRGADAPLARPLRGQVPRHRLPRHPPPRLRRRRRRAGIRRRRRLGRSRILGQPVRLDRPGPVRRARSCGPVTSAKSRVAASPTVDVS